MKQIQMLSSQYLPSPRLRFDYAIRSHVSDTAFDGFRRWGPYDKNQPRSPSIRILVLYPKSAVQEMRKLREAFQRGMHFFKGFQQFSRGISISSFEPVPLEIIETNSLPQQAEIYRNAINSLGDISNVDLAFALIPYSPRYLLETPYYAVKTELSARGIPCQLLTTQKVRSDETFKWSLSNIALQVYAKLGYVPWVAETPDQPSDLIVGIGQRLVRGGRIGPLKRYIGFTTAYKNNGAFLTFQGIAGMGSEEDYCEKLSQAISKGIEAFRNNQSKQGAVSVNPERVILHSFKKISQREIEAIEGGIRKSSINCELIPYCLINIDRSSNFLVFDNEHKSYLPGSGLNVWLGPLQVLLLTEGRERYEHQKMGFPSPLRIQLDTRSKLNNVDLADVFPGLLEQINSLSKVNWRGFNAAAIPITLSYSSLIADLISSCQDPDLWSKIANASNLEDKAWFL